MNGKAWEKVMFEVYQEEGYGGRYRVVYFTELGTHEREAAINRALSGRHVYDGFLRTGRIAEAKAAIAELLERWNAGEAESVGALEEALADHAA